MHLLLPHCNSFPTLFKFLKTNELKRAYLNLVLHDILAPDVSRGVQHLRLSFWLKVGEGLGNNEMEALKKGILQKIFVDKILRMGIECKDIYIPCERSSKDMNSRRDSQ